ncbi:PDDEXK nuclease domain-containing protein [Segatella copri]|uniref:PDDEXK nuclease domain-containing protein n=1 Tax=Segatella copri TaxID=165179 RepID=UPI001C452415|nr:PDDEXK nuclease domain-containing protein [Segatella copri]MBW0025827.1 DUF1016 family protein [Segatella copri]
MSKLISTDKEYAAWVADLKHRFRSAQIKAAVKVNRELLIYYWQLGRDMVNMNIEERWGEGIMKTLSQDLKDAMPEENGFSKTNLYYIKKFYTTYSQIVINFPQVGGKIETPHSVQFLPQVGEKEQDIAEMLFSIPWTHHKFILDKIKGDVVIEVKVTEFEPSYLGQLSAYISFVNHTLKSDADNPTIGLLICKSKDNIFAQYSLEGYNQPIGISEFEGVNLLPTEFKSSLPSIEDIEAELEKNSKQ